MDDSTLSEPFYLSRGGFFYRLMLRTRLIQENKYHEWRRIAVFVSLTWLPLFILSALAGALAGGNTRLPFLLDPGPYGKYLFALPIIVVADRIIDRLLVAVVQYFETSGLLPDEARARFRGALLELGRRRDSVLAEVTLILVLFSDAARIDLRVVRRDHDLPVRMLLIGMPLIIAGGTVLGLASFLLERH